MRVSAARSRASLPFAVGLTVVLVAGVVSAQETLRNEIGIGAGGSFANGHAFGFAQDTSLWLAEVRYGRAFFADDGIAFRYLAKVAPLALVGERLTGGRRYTYGAGLSPIGIQLNLLTARRVQPFLASSGGFLYFTDTILSRDATQFNFTVEVGAGTQIFSSPRRAFTLAYKYHHISNANIHRRNPGLDTHMAWVGLSFLW